MLNITVVTLAHGDQRYISSAHNIEGGLVEAKRLLGVLGWASALVRFDAWVTNSDGSVRRAMDPFAVQVHDQ